MKRAVAPAAIARGPVRFCGAAGAQSE